MKPDDGAVDRLYGALPPRYRWPFADEILLEALRHGTPVRRGPRGQALHVVMTALTACGLAVPAVTTVGAIEACTLLFRQARHTGRAASRKGSATTVPTSNVYVFVGFGARAEESLFERYRAGLPAGTATLRIDQCNLPETGSIALVSARQIWRTLRQAVTDIRAAVASLPPRFRERTADFMTSAAKRLGTFVYARAWWRSVRERFDIREACFVAADANAFAAIAEGVRASFLQHGLLSKDLLLPEFHDVFPLTRYEQAFIRRRLPDAAVHPARHTVLSECATHTRSLLIASGDRVFDEMMLMIPLVRRLSQEGIETHVRLFPGEAPSRFWGTEPVGDPPLRISTGGGSFDQQVTELKPMFIASWGSTVLAEALYRGIIPICVASDDDRYVSATVFPLFRCCLRWPADDREILAVAANPAAYGATLQRLRRQENRPDLEGISVTIPESVALDWRA